jgi:hypothetical protein
LRKSGIIDHKLNFVQAKYVIINTSCLLMFACAAKAAFTAL